MSEELENSLQQSIETYVNERLRGIDEQLARLQTEFNDAFARLRESTTSGQMETPVSSAITAHLQAAREQKLSGAATPQAPSPDLSNLKRAIEDIQNQQTQTDVLSALLRNALPFADRVALFVVKGDQAIGWRSFGVLDKSKLQPMNFALPLAGDTVVSNAARSGSAETALGTNAENRVLIEQLGGDPRQLAAMPLAVRHRTVAVLYADSSWPHQDAIQLDALEILTRFAGVAIDLVSPTRAAHPQSSAPAPAPETKPEPAPVYAPHVETQPTSVAVEEQAPAEAVAEDVEPAAPQMAEEPQQTAPAAEEPTASAEQPPEVQPAPPAYTTQYSAPLGSARRWGVAEPELPIEVGEDERRLHNDARRFARLLVSEIKLYNEQKVNEGRSQGNIYDRLREDIDRSRQMYDKRVAPPVAARHDYFHQELVNTLAEGDSSKLGNSYPGAAVGVS